jgi:hypothetical protein
MRQIFSLIVILSFCSFTLCQQQPNFWKDLQAIPKDFYDFSDGFFKGAVFLDTPNSEKCFNEAKANVESVTSLIDIFSKINDRSDFEAVYKVILTGFSNFFTHLVEVYTPCVSFFKKEEKENLWKLGQNFANPEYWNKIVQTLIFKLGDLKNTIEKLIDLFNQQNKRVYDIGFGLGNVLRLALFPDVRPRSFLA